MIYRLVNAAAPKGRPPAPVAGSLLPVLLTVALLLCHGVLGFAHQVSACGSCGSAEVPGLPGVHHGPATDAGVAAGGPMGDEAVSGPGKTGYFGAMITLFGMALLGLLFVAPGRREADAFRRSIFRSPRPPASVHHPRGPSPPLLQAFRL